MRFTHAIYQPGQPGLQTSLSEDAHGNRRADFTSHRQPDGTYGEDKPADVYLAELNAARDKDTPQFEILAWDELLPMLTAAQDAMFVTAWQPITRDRYVKALECLPPCKWMHINGVEIFYCSEALTSNIHAHYACHHDQCFSRNCRTTVPYSVLAEQVRFIVAAEE